MPKQTGLAAVVSPLVPGPLTYRCVWPPEAKAKPKSESESKAEAEAEPSSRLNEAEANRKIVSILGKY